MTQIITEEQANKNLRNQRDISHHNYSNTMSIKHLVFITIITFLSTPFANAQSAVYIGSSDDHLWKTIPGKDQGTASASTGTITMVSDSNLFYILDQEQDFRNISLSYNINSLNERSHTGVIVRYVSPDDWVYVGCDLTSDIFGYSAWYVETPSFRKEIARDIAKLYKDFTRSIRIDCIDEAITLRIDNEIAASVNIPGLGAKAGKFGFRAHQGGAAVISDITCKEAQVATFTKMTKTYNIQSGRLEVALSKSFPTPVKYTWKKNVALPANDRLYEYINLNGDFYAVKGSGKQIDKSTVRYSLNVPDVKVDIQVECRIRDHIFETMITKIREGGSFKVYTIGFPGQYLVSMPNTAPGGMLSIAVNEGSDRFFALKDKSRDTINCVAAIAILNNDRVAVSLDNNSIYETKQFVYRCNGDVTSIGNNEWIYRGVDGKTTELPWSKVIFAGDQNSDNVVNWQDGAVALSEIYPDPYGVERVRNSNVTITMNFASEAQFPFLRQLDNIKKVYYLTDGFRQMLELKGYQAEGHDTGHPDYAGHYNTRSGGLKDLQTLVSEAKRYNAYIGLHINESEAHPSAKAYNHQIVTDIPAWKWLDQAYLMNKEEDVLSGSFQNRLDNLKKDLDGLDFIYIDTYREHRYLAYNTAKLFNERGWSVWTEDPSVFNRYGVWIHYHPESKSLISRFVHGTRKDAFANDSLFGGGYDRGAAIGFQGWQNGKDMYRAIRNFYTNQLPYRYLMQSPVIYADPYKLRFRNGTETRRENGVTSMYNNGRLIQKGNVVFIPWSQQNQEKIYHYNPDGGSTSWELPPSWKGVAKVYCYALTETGRMAPEVLPVVDNRITLNAEKDRPYAIYKTEAPGFLVADWSHGSPVGDMGFDSQGFGYWEKTGNPEGVQIAKTPYGQSELKITGSKEAGVSQMLRGLEKGKSYSAWVWVQVNGKRKATLEVLGYGGEPVSASMEETLVLNTQVNSDKRGSYYQLLRVQFTQNTDQANTRLNLSAEATKDTSSVIFDDVRVVETNITSREGYAYYEDFEHVDFGWSGWMLSRPGEAKTHLSERHDPYTDDVIDGNWSLKLLDQGRNGETIRTMPSLIRLAPNTKYRISFQYLAPEKESFQIKAFSSKTKQELMSHPLVGNGLFEATFQTDDSDDCYLSIYQTDKGMLVIDNFGIRLEN